MDMYPKYTSPFGYQTGVGGIDTYGVNHNNFSLRDELEYQFARQKRENQLMQQYNNQGITENYPQYGTNFWGNSANNYGFGNSNISANIENMQNNTTPIPVAIAMPQATAVPQNQGVQQSIQTQNPLQQIVGAAGDMVRNYIDMKRDNTIKGDDYFHCKANYEAAQRGEIGENIAEKLGNAKEEFDFWDNQFRKGLSPQEAFSDRIHDKTINQIGRQMAKSGLYKNSRKACYPYRVNGINEKY